MNQEILEIAKDYYIKVKFVEESEETPRNHSWVIGNDEVWLGVYDDPELQLISFFHELGHTLITEYDVEKYDYSTLLIEILCWNIGVEEARLNNILFSDDAIKWGYEQALTYAGHDERELVVESWEKRKNKLWRYSHDRA